jgi:hypothetical protein
MSSLNKIFYKVVYYHAIYICDFLVNLYDFFIVVCKSFHEKCDLHPICSILIKLTTKTKKSSPKSSLLASVPVVQP